MLSICTKKKIYIYIYLLIINGKSQFIDCFIKKFVISHSFYLILYNVNFFFNLLCIIIQNFGKWIWLFSKSSIQNARMWWNKEKKEKEKKSDEQRKQVLFLRDAILFSASAPLIPVFCNCHSCIWVIWRPFWIPRRIKKISLNAYRPGVHYRRMKRIIK